MIKKKNRKKKKEIINEYYNTNLNSQKSFDKLYKDKFTQQQLGSTI